MKKFLKIFSLALVLCTGMIFFAACGQEEPETITVLKLATVIISTEEQTSSDIEIDSFSIATSGASVYGTSPVYSQSDIGERLSNIDFFFLNVNNNARIKYFISGTTEKIRLNISFSLFMNNSVGYTPYSQTKTYTITERTDGKFEITETVAQERSGLSYFGDITMKLIFEKVEVE